MNTTNPITPEEYKLVFYGEKTRTDIDRKIKQNYDYTFLLQLILNIQLFDKLLNIGGTTTPDTLPQISKTNMIRVLSNYIFSCSSSNLGNLYKMMSGYDIIFEQNNSLDTLYVTMHEIEFIDRVIFNIRTLILFLYHTTDNFPERVYRLLVEFDLGLAYRGIDYEDETAVASVVCDIESHLCAPFSCFSRFLTRTHWLVHIIACLTFNNPCLDQYDMILYYYTNRRNIVYNINILPRDLSNIVSSYERSESCEITFEAFAGLYELIYSGRVL